MRSVTRWNADTRARAVALADQGHSSRAISIELDVPLSTVQRWLSNGRTRPNYDAATRARALDMHRDGVSMSEISRTLHVHKTTVAYWLREVREPMNRRHSPEIVRQALARLDAGAQIQDVAREMEVPPGTIHNWVARRDSDAMVDRLYGGDRRARYAIHRPALALALSGAWR